MPRMPLGLGCTSLSCAGRAAGTLPLFCRPEPRPHPPSLRSSAALSRSWGRTAWAWPPWCLHLLPAEADVCTSHLCPRAQPWLALIHPRLARSPPRRSSSCHRWSEPCGPSGPTVRQAPSEAHVPGPPQFGPDLWSAACSSLCLDLLSLFLPVQVPPVR